MSAPFAWVPHGTGRCICDSMGEHPECPHHGYEAVIYRMRSEIERLRDWIDTEGRTCPSNKTVDACLAEWGPL